MIYWTYLTDDRSFCHRNVVCLGYFLIFLRAILTLAYYLIYAYFY